MIHVELIVISVLTFTECAWHGYPGLGPLLWPPYTWMCLVLKQKLWGPSLWAAFCGWRNRGSEKGGDLPRATERMAWAGLRCRRGGLRPRPGFLPPSSPASQRARTNAENTSDLLGQLGILAAILLWNFVVKTILYFFILMPFISVIFIYFLTFKFSCNF